MNGRVQTRMGNALSEYAPTGVYPCAGAERWVAVAAPTDEVWRARCAERQTRLGQRYPVRYCPARLENREALDAAITAWTVRLQPGALEELLQGAGSTVKLLYSRPHSATLKLNANRRFWRASRG